MNIEHIKVKKGNFDFSTPNMWEEFYWSIYRFFNKAYRYVYYLIKPNHKTLRKVIPREWRDLDGITEDFLNAVIISFVEEENGLDQIKMIMDSLNKDDEYLKKEWGSVEIFWDYYNDRYGDYMRLQSIYNWVKSGKKSMKNYLDSVEKANNWKEYSKVENAIYNKDSEYLADLVRLRKYLWT
jgi:hypothetical protein